MISSSSMAERLIVNQKVVGSSPTLRAKFLKKILDFKKSL